MLNVKAREAADTIFQVFGMTQLRILVSNGSSLSTTRVKNVRMDILLIAGLPVIADWLERPPCSR